MSDNNKPASPHHSPLTWTTGQAGGTEFIQTIPQGAVQGQTKFALCLHGIGGNAKAFEPQLVSLGATRKTMAWNMPGYGHSVLPETLDFNSLAEAVIKLLDACRVEQVDLIGHSIGGMIAIETALQFPERVSTLSLLATTAAFGGRDDSFKQTFLKQRLAPLESGTTMATLARQFVPEITGDNISHDYHELAVESMAAVPIDSYRAVLQCLVTFNRREEVKSLHQPCCLIAGSQDNNAPARTMQKLAHTLADAQYHCIEGAGHLLNLEAPDEVNGILNEFLDRHS